MLHRPMHWSESAGRIPVFENRRGSGSAAERHYAYPPYNMRQREEIHADFAKRFVVPSTSNPARNRPPTGDELDAVEATLKARFPVSYREFVTRHGCVWTPKLADQLEATGRLVPRAIEEFTPLDCMVEYDRWNASIPRPLLLFAGDSLGDMIGFPKQSARVDDLPVFLFDHEFNEVIQLGETFDGLLDAYVYGTSAGG